MEMQDVLIFVGDDFDEHFVKEVVFFVLRQVDHQHLALIAFEIQALGAGGRLREITHQSTFRIVYQSHDHARVAIDAGWLLKLEEFLNGIQHLRLEALRQSFRPPLRVIYVNMNPNQDAFGHAPAIPSLCARISGLHQKPVGKIRGRRFRNSVGWAGGR